MGKIIDRVRERAIEARRIKLLKEQMNQPLVLEVQPVDRSRAAPKAVPIGQERFEFDSLIIEVNGSTSKLIAKKGAEVVHTSTDKIKGYGIPDNLTLFLMYGGFKAVSNPV